MIQPNFARLKSQLATSGLAQTNITLFQIINSLIDAMTQMQDATGESITNTVTNIISTSLSTEWDVLTDGDLIEPELIYAGGEVIMGHKP